jgi:uncharacterized membrane protein YgdD (TMEM256/DUF423 family)
MEGWKLNGKTWLVLGASLGALGVAAGTFGVHYLPKYLDAAGASAVLAERQQWWETGVRYQMYHALALLGLAWVADRQKTLLPSLAGMAMFAGTLIFSGCLYALGLTGFRVIGAIVPLGGVLFIAGWILLALAGRGLAEEPTDKKLTPREKLLSENKPAINGPAAEEPSGTEG